jgi:hypothetical protein
MFSRRHAELVSASIPEPLRRLAAWTLKQVQGDEEEKQRREGGTR